MLHAQKRSSRRLATFVRRRARGEEQANLPAPHRRHRSSSTSFRDQQDRASRTASSQRRRMRRCQLIFARHGEERKELRIYKKGGHERAESSETRSRCPGRGAGRGRRILGERDVERVLRGEGELVSLGGERATTGARERAGGDEDAHLAVLDLLRAQHLAEPHELRDVRHDRVALHRRRRNDLVALCERGGERVSAGSGTSRSPASVRHAALEARYRRERLRSSACTESEEGDALR